MSLVSVLKTRAALRLARPLVRAAVKKVPELEKRAVVLWLKSKGVELEPWQKARLGIDDED